VLLTDVGKHLLVISPGIFFLSFSKWYVVRNAADSCVRSGILLGYLERNTHWSHGDAARPIKLDMTCPNILLGLLYGISRIPSRLRSNATRSNKGYYENAQDFHLADNKIGYVSESEVFMHDVIPR
jgi:hypothetical protein